MLNCAKKQHKISNGVNKPQPKIRVFSTPSCPYCVVLKEFLKENKIEFEEIDVSKNEKAAQEMIEKSGQMGVPVIEIDGKIVVGFDRERISKLLNIKE